MTVILAHLNHEFEGEAVFQDFHNINLCIPKYLPSLLNIGRLLAAVCAVVAE